MNDISGGDLKNALTINVGDHIVKLIKKEDDPWGVTRISAGGAPGLARYIVYRGPIRDVKLCLLECLAAIEQAISRNQLKDE